jgi:hypothetical protein
VWAEMQAQVEELTGQAGLQILRAILENEVTHRVGPPHRPNPTAGCVRWGKQPGYVVFGGQKIPLERPRVRTREVCLPKIPSGANTFEISNIHWSARAVGRGGHYSS